DVIGHDEVAPVEPRLHAPSFILQRRSSDATTKSNFARWYVREHRTRAEIEIDQHAEDGRIGDRKRLEDMYQAHPAVIAAAAPWRDRLDRREPAGTRPGNRSRPPRTPGTLRLASPL